MLLMHTPQGLIDLHASPDTWGPPNWERIAHALALSCRWCGNTSRHYSIAEHSLRVAHLVPAHLRLAALLHDSAEAFVGDVPAPLRRAGATGAFEDYDEKISAWLFRSAGILDQIGAVELWKADAVLAATEFRDLCGGDPEAVGMARPLGASIPVEVPDGFDPRGQWLFELGKRLK